MNTNNNIEESTYSNSRFQTIFGIETGLVFMLILSYFGAIGSLISAVKVYHDYAISMPRFDFALVFNIIISCFYLIWTIFATVLIVKKHKDSLFLSKALIIFYIVYQVALLIVSLVYPENDLTNNARHISDIVLYGIYLSYLCVNKRLKTIFPKRQPAFMSVASVVVMSAIPTFLFLLGIIHDNSVTKMVNKELSSLSESEDFQLQRNLTFDIPAGCECEQVKKSTLGVDITIYTINDDNGNSIVLFSINADEFTEKHFIESWNDFVNEFEDEFKIVGNDSPVHMKHWNKYSGLEKQATYSMTLYPEVTMQFTLCQLYNREQSQICTVAFIEFAGLFDKERFINSIKY